MNGIAIQITRILLKTLLIPFVIQLMDSATSFLNKKLKNLMEDNDG